MKTNSPRPANRMPERLPYKKSPAVKHKRYPLRKMTIALGMLCSDGIVLAADSEEGTGYAGDLKVSSPKIFAMRLTKLNGQKVTGAISGAGRVRYLDTVKQELITTLLGSRETEEPENVYPEIQSRLFEFYNNHIIPFAALPDHDRPEVSLLMAREYGECRRLWSTDKTTIQEYEFWGAVGAGAAYASILLKGYSPPIDVARAKVLLAYVVYKVKQVIGGCGIGTDVAVLSRENVEFIGWGDMGRMEEAFRCWDEVESRLFRYVMGDQRMDSHRLMAWLDTMQGEYLEFAGLSSNPEDQ